MAQCSRRGRPVPAASVPAASAWAASELEPTGIELVNAPGVESMAVDGTGAVWVRSPWQLTRVDPTTGSCADMGCR